MFNFKSTFSYHGPIP